MKLKLFSVLVLLMSSFSVAANGYVGFSYGSTAVKADLTSIGGNTLDDTTTLTRFYGGYRLHKYLAFEAAWFDLASVSVGQLGTGSTAVSGYVDMKALGIYGVALVPLTRRVSAFVKAGGASWDADLQVNNTTAAADGFDALYGLLRPGRGRIGEHHVAVFIDGAVDGCLGERGQGKHLSLIHISEPTRQLASSRMPSSA